MSRGGNNTNASSSRKRGRGRGRGRSGCGVGASCWWASLSDSCPISLVPLSELEHPPFGLASKGAMTGQEVAVTHLFDARFLAHWLVSSGDLSDPVNRRPLTRTECVDLDEHVQLHHPELDAVSVTDAFDLQARRQACRGDRDQQSESQILQREANTVLQSLFQWRRQGSRGASDAAGHRVVFREGGLQVVDDDDVIAGPATTPSTLQTEFPPLTEASTEAPTASWPCPLRPYSSTQCEDPYPSFASAPPAHDAKTETSNRPRLQLKPRSKDLAEPGGAARSEAIFGAARPREESLQEAGRTVNIEEVATSGSLCAYSRTVLADLLSLEQQIRTRLLPNVEQALKDFLADSAVRAIELGSLIPASLPSIRELCDQCLLDSECIGSISADGGSQGLKILKNASSRKPLCWLTAAVGPFSHLVKQSTNSVQRRSTDNLVLLSFLGTEGKGTGLDEALRGFAKASDFEEPLWLHGGRHVLLRFARRSAAQRCCAVTRSGLWAAQWWSGDAEWAQWQLARLSAGQRQKRDSATTSARIAREPQFKVAVGMPGISATKGGKWAALATDEDDDDDDDDDKHEDTDENTDDEITQSNTSEHNSENQDEVKHGDTR